MLLLYNGTILPEEELRMPLTNRAFQYNDGFFETVMVVEGRLRFWPDHQERMREAALALKLQLPNEFFSSAFEEKLVELTEKCNASSLGRLKLKVWRAGEGLYTPQNHQVEWLVTAQAAVPVSDEPIRVGVCQHVQTIFSSLSHFKGPNALLYVLAGTEKQEKEQGDMLLLDRQHMVAELISSNIFWVSENVLYTPALETGCVNGILRRNILRHCHSAGIEVREVFVGLDHLKDADAAFSANVTGLRVIGALEDKTFKDFHPLISQLRDALT
jgi:branched-chain amino acid aminotransferase/4-amino-4-deoxychorismate lyase